MAIFTTVKKNKVNWVAPVVVEAPIVDFLFSDNTDFLFSDGSDYLFSKGSREDTAWTGTGKDRAAWVAPIVVPTVSPLQDFLFSDNTDFLFSDGSDYLFKIESTSIRQDTPWTLTNKTR